ncbi:1-aminocyclopropane-1-carboxylate deaminase/D-cysteine desulfhydrase [Amycolatopsis nalaikhensis]|uniref:D-cysteine desulfhydrase family protein n=1 Tax=Amycolatopsis nalaikhensis TaxID=715472 RepID=A0ABY8XI78_9PSEU|nr:D-cysteine desulfhydrase family protein [Amycolatopsis sp. 2-2]WIV55307.1 D-cysteine desulfhydrase family protein [Amycolatopsis sp. 2-2]
MDLTTRLARFPREHLALTPTPLDELSRLSAELGPRVLLKRDDLTGLALGGDKPRKLEYELARARRDGADVVVTCGSMQSNHARLTTAAARRLGMDCTVVLSRDAYDEFQGNLLTVRLLGADVRVVDVADHWGLDTHVQAVCDELRAAGRRPHAVPISGTTPHSCLGYVRAGLELAAQLRERGERPDAVYLPFGTGGIFTAVTLALRDQGFPCPVIGISVNQDRDACQADYRHWWGELTALLEIGAPPPEVEIHDEFVGREYGDPTEACLDAILLLARTEGVLLDPVYSGKTFAGFLAHQAAGRWGAGHRVVVLHSGGVPALFAYHDALAEHLAKRG